ncbi:unnamed protein product [Moneuplotes crassus]|uniref:Uncharacterized protein n=1 Tax=Euplotes crassus TaxID=5936 RepID=A0AAD1U5U2_EUPCR|nr:unnamed protein product [Moneuplotes crassus]
MGDRDWFFGRQSIEKVVEGGKDNSMGKCRYLVEFKRKAFICFHYQKMIKICISFTH